MNTNCTHNTMIENEENGYAWKCADCGYVYGKTQHTPGPWTLQHLESNHHGYDWNTYCVRSRGGNACLATVGDVDRATAEHNEANARLMVASPELLDACVRVLASIERNLADEFLPETRAVLRAAIAKAIGQ